MGCFESVAALNVTISNTQNQAETDSDAATAFGTWSNTILQACNESSSQMTNEVSEQATNGGSSSSTNNNLTDAEQIETTMQTLFQSLQKFAGSFETSETNEVNADTNNEKSEINQNNYIQAELATTASLLTQNY